MNKNLIQSTLSVATVLKEWPNTARIFLRHHAACVGCYLTRFCTLEDAINTYHLDGAAFLDDLEQVSTNSNCAKGTQDEKYQ